MFQTLLDLLNESGADIAVCNYHQQSASGQVLRNHGFGRAYMGPDDIRGKYVESYYEGKASGFNSIWNKLYTARLILEHRLVFDETRVRAEDVFFNLAACAHARGIVFTDQALYHYHDNADSIMHTFLRSQLAFWERDAREALLFNDRWFHLPLDLNAYYRNIITQAANMMADAFILRRADRREVWRSFFK